VNRVFGGWIALKFKGLAWLNILRFWQLELLYYSIITSPSPSNLLSLWCSSYILYIHISNARVFNLNSTHPPIPIHPLQLYYILFTQKDILRRLCNCDRCEEQWSFVRKVGNESIYKMYRVLCNYILYNFLTKLFLYFTIYITLTFNDYTFSRVTSFRVWKSLLLCTFYFSYIFYI